MITIKIGKKINEYKDKIPGGLADKKKPKDFDSEQLKKGIKVELEHTSDYAIAREIAMDHLTEDPLYYKKLKTIETNENSLVSPVYHGSDSDIKKFDFLKTTEFGFHFGTKESAKHRGNNKFLKSYSLSIKNPLILDDVMRWDLHNVLNNMQIKNYLSKNEVIEIKRNLINQAIQKSKASGTSLRQEKNIVLRDFLQKKGYDGVIYDNRGEAGGKAYIAFEPEQIKEI